MQSIVSLNALVTQLTEKISELTISFADTKADVRLAFALVTALVLGIGALGDPPATPNLHQAFSPRIRYIWMYQPNGSFNVVISTCPMS